MTGIKVEGIILKRRNFGEADRVLTVFSYQKGKISVLAKGVRRITSRRGGNVELLNRSVMYLHPAKSFLILTEAAVLDTYHKLKEDLVLSAYAFHIIELVDKLIAENQENKVLYEDLVSVLQRLSRNPRQILIRAFEVKILSGQGFANFGPPATLREAMRAEELKSVGETGEILKKLEILPWDEIEKLNISEKQALELQRLLQYHVERVIEGSLKSRQMLGRL